MASMARQPEAASELTRALDAAQTGEWSRAHGIVQAHDGDPLANWLHARHHKVEGNARNARYWYAKSPMNYERFADPELELQAIRQALTDEG